MRYLFLLSGENLELAKAEVLSLAKAFGKILSYDLDERIFSLNFAGEQFFERLALSHEVCEAIFSCSMSELQKEFEKLSFEGSCCVRVSGIGMKSDQELEKKLGAILWKKGAQIDLRNPENLIRVYITPRSCHVGFLRFKQNKKQFRERLPNKRPFFMPVVILPKLSRAILNLVSLKSGRILDPMCGTGSFLIEAGLMGFEVFGMDFYRDIVKGCRKNLEFFNLKGEVLQGDVREMPFKDESFDGIATDYPYFRATRSGTKDELYNKSFQEISRVLRKGCRAVLVTNLELKELPFKVIFKIDHRVHGSLTRRIYVVEKFENVPE
ncbi:MAG: methyltransferase domain-containing protein [Archaeoglobaceae archaeon]|nr:methyltransferase domain-containing protein [Archaeoglobaceae archaeon]MDW8128590.1 methyltransferase domain-containing protein [Archaeoglobaceae archaeon]